MVTRRALLLLVLGAGVGGCVIPIPRSTEGEGVRPPWAKDQLDGVREGVTRRRDVLLILGEPDEVHHLGPATVDCYVTEANRVDLHIGLPIPARAEVVLNEASLTFLFVKSNHAGVVEKVAFRRIHYSVDFFGTPKKPVRVLEEVKEWDGSQ